MRPYGIYGPSGISSLVAMRVRISLMVKRISKGTRISNALVLIRLSPLPNPTVCVIASSVISGVSSFPSSIVNFLVAGSIAV